MVFVGWGSFFSPCLCFCVGFTGIVLCSFVLLVVVCLIVSTSAFDDWKDFS